ncbi:alpha/beta hydrolase [Marivibrio halodurans]|uniref:Alpha/beta hydrolase n=1 Tax=Marivibrio halodurans TaxID=2039722 RepID=A0A8J7V027_9PROT|nr:alpha/beta hydrolase [Marivibrio halodurans]MBP5856306.1 alpha/beta hydrolase [Marivibrio halodurans]
MSPDSLTIADSETFFVDIAETRLECVRHAPPRDGAHGGDATGGDTTGGDSAARPTIVMLHEGLGSVAMWKDFPAALATESGHPVLVYSRHGYGRSSRLAAPFGTDYMHREALETLPALLDRLGIESPILFGHSDGASIALIHAGGAGRAVAGLILEAPHVFVEDLTITSIEQAKTAFQTTDLVTKLGRYHDDADSSFRGWNDIWLHPEFRAWNIEEFLPQVVAPVLAIQGADDEYGTLDQLDAIERGATGRVEKLVLETCKHSPHRDRREAVLKAADDFLKAL